MAYDKPPPPADLVDAKWDRIHNEADPTVRKHLVLTEELRLRLELADVAVSAHGRQRYTFRG
jgi:hypothetical protein